MWILLLLAIAAPRGAWCDDAGPATPADDLTFTEKAALPAKLYQDYMTERIAAGPKGIPAVVDKYRRLIKALDALPREKRDEFTGRFNSTREKNDRDDLVDAYTHVGSPEPLKTFKLGNDSADVTLTIPKWHLAPEVGIGGDMKVGMLAPFGGTGDQNSTLKESPYVHAALTGAYDGIVHALVVVTGDVSVLQSHKVFNDPTGDSASNAGSLRKQSDFSQTFAVGSVYTDVVGTAKFGDGLRAAVYAAGDAIVYSPTAPNGTNPTVPMISLTGGTMWMVKRAQDEYTAYTDVRLQGVSKDTKKYGEYGVAPSVAAGFEYAHDPAKKDHVAVGGEGVVSPGDAGLRPYVSLKSGDVNALVAGDLRQSRNDFYPSVLGGGASLSWQATPAMKVGVKGSLSAEKFNMAPAPELGYTGMTTLDFDLDAKTKIATRARLPDRYPQAGIVADAAELNRHAAGSAYSKVDFMEALKASPTMPGFAEKIGANSVDEILSALSALSADLNKWNYDKNNNGWAGTDEELYANARKSILTSKKDPDLQCVGAATFLSHLAVEMGRRAGVQIEAAASSVEVPSATGEQETHFVALVKTRPYGIVFLDWGQLTPTYEFDTRKALAIFQGLQGIPQVAHYIADTAGHFGGYLFSDDGKVMIENMSYHSELPSSEVHQLFRDDPESASIVEGRAKKYLQNDR
jgi:hypothetical protein